MVERLIKQRRVDHEVCYSRFLVLVQKTRIVTFPYLKVIWCTNNHVLWLSVQMGYQNGVEYIMKLSWSWYETWIRWIQYKDTKMYSIVVCNTFWRNHSNNAMLCLWYVVWSIKWKRILYKYTVCMIDNVWSIVICIWYEEIWSSGVLRWKRAWRTADWVTYDDFVTIGADSVSEIHCIIELMFNSPIVVWE